LELFLAGFSRIVIKLVFCTNLGGLEGLFASSGSLIIQLHNFMDIFLASHRVVQGLIAGSNCFPKKAALLVKAAFFF